MYYSVMVLVNKVLTLHNLRRYHGMVELADTQVLKTCEISREGASPSTVTIIARMTIVPTDECFILYKGFGAINK